MIPLSDLLPTLTCVVALSIVVTSTLPTRSASPVGNCADLSQEMRAPTATAVACSAKSILGHVGHEFNKLRLAALSHQGVDA